MSNEKPETISERNDGVSQSDWLKGEISCYARMLVESDKTNMIAVHNIIGKLKALAARLDEIAERYEVD